MVEIFWRIEAVKPSLRKTRSSRHGRHGKTDFGRELKNTFTRRADSLTGSKDSWGQNFVSNISPALMALNPNCQTSPADKHARGGATRRYRCRAGSRALVAR